jgi:hypothetical protein
MISRPVCLDPTPFVRHFGALVEISSPAQNLALHALQTLSGRFSLPPPPAIGITKDGYMGVHLRTEVDAMAVGYTSFETQAFSYINEISSTALRTVYAASGNETSLELFSQLAAKLDPPAQVVTKWDLLSDKDAAVLNDMTWDQQALVDYLILEKSSKFLGVSDSSFSWGLVYARQPFSEEGLCGKSKELEGFKQFEDNLSAIYGKFRDWHIHKLWP